MITLKTLPLATAQEVFEQGARHMLKQGVRSVDEYKKCMYRHGDLKCVGGCFIADDEYMNEMEYKSWGTLSVFGLVPKSHSQLIQQLQCIHDSWEPKNWRFRLKEFGRRHKFNVSFLKEI